MVFSICGAYECYRSGFAAFLHFIQGDIIQSWGTNYGTPSDNGPGRLLSEGDTYLHDSSGSCSAVVDNHDHQIYIQIV